jgi:hypothetical protein
MKIKCECSAHPLVTMPDVNKTPFVSSRNMPDRRVIRASEVAVTTEFAACGSDIGQRRLRREADASEGRAGFSVKQSLAMLSIDSR